MTRLFFLTLLILLSSCAEPQSEPVSSADSDSVKVYTGGKGRIQSIVADGNMAIIVHDEIPGLMSAMTMPFGIREDSIRSEIAEGDSIAFEVSSNGIDSWISRVTVIR